MHKLTDKTWYKHFHSRPKTAACKKILQVSLLQVAYKGWSRQRFWWNWPHRKLNWSRNRNVVPVKFTQMSFQVHFFLESGSLLCIGQLSYPCFISLILAARSGWFVNVCTLSLDLYYGGTVPRMMAMLDGSSLILCVSSCGWFLYFISCHCAPLLSQLHLWRSDRQKRVHDR